MKKKQSSRNYSFDKSYYNRNHQFNFQHHQEYQNYQNINPNYNLQKQQNKQSLQIIQLRQQLRQSLEEVQQYKLSSQLEIQKRTLVQQKYHNLKQENILIKNQFDQLKQDFLKFKKKQQKIKTKEKQNICEKCKDFTEKINQLERQKNVYLKEKNTLKNQIKKLQKIIDENNSQNQIQRVKNLMQSMKKERQHLLSTIDSQRKIINLLDDKISSFEIQTLQTLGNVQLAQQKIEQLKMQNNLLKGFSRSQKSPRRKTGSIKSFDKYSKLGTQQQKESLIC